MYGGYELGLKEVASNSNYYPAFFWFQIRNGKRASVWFDNWCAQSPLVRLLIAREISRSGFSLRESVADLVQDGVWRWPNEWFSRFSDLSQVHIPYLLDSVKDEMIW